MSYFTVAKRLTGLFPMLPLALAQDSVAKAVESIYDATDWSFQKQRAGWLAPGIVFNAGTTTVTPFQNTVVCDASLTAQLAAYTGRPLITELQYRNPGYALYSIVAYDTTTNAPLATLTLDRPWMENTSGPGQPYMIYQSLFAAPVPDFRKFVEIRDPTDDQPLDFWSLTQADLAVRDPERLDFSDSSYVVPAGVDQRPGSATLGYQLFELWPHQTNKVPYPFTFRRRGPVPQSGTDFLSTTTPYPITEAMVEWRAREMICQFKEGQKGEQVARGSGANWLLLSQMAQKEYMYLFGQQLAIDLNLDGEAQTRVMHGSYRSSPYATMGGGINLGGYRGGGDA